MYKMAFIVCLLCALAGSAQEREMEIWNKNQISVTPVHKLLLKVDENIHYSTLRSSISLKYVEVFVGHRLKNWIEYGGGYRVASSWLVSNVWEKENRTMLYIDFTEPVKKFKIGFSNRFEYRNFEHLEDYFRYRQSLKLDFPSLIQWGMRFYVSEESYYKLNGDGTHLARIYAGITVLDKRRINLSTYYALQKSKLIEEWYTSDVLGMNLSISI